MIYAHVLRVFLFVGRTRKYLVENGAETLVQGECDAELAVQDLDLIDKLLRQVGHVAPLLDLCLEVIYADGL